MKYVQKIYYHQKRSSLSSLPAFPKRNLENKKKCKKPPTMKIIAQNFDKDNAFPADIYLLKVNNRNNRKRCEICSKLTIQTPERRH